MYGHRLLRELFGLLFLFCGLLMLLSLWSYDIADPNFNQATSVPVIHNAAGQFGAYLAGFFVEWFGIASFLWVLLFLVIGAGLVSRWLVIKWYRWIGYLLLYVCALAFFSAVGITFHGMEGGGFTGKKLCEISCRFFSPYGSALVFFFAFLIAMELSFKVSWLALLSGFFSWLIRHIPSFGDTFDLPFAKFFSKLKKFSLPSFSGKALLEKLKFKKKERPRPTLDILTHTEASKDLPLPDEKAPSLSFTLEEDSPQENTAPEASQPNRVEETPEPLSLEGNLELAEDAVSDPAKAIPENSAEISGAGEFLLELEDEPKGAPALEAPEALPDPLPDVADSTDGAEAPSQREEILPWDDVKDEQEPAAQAAFSAPLGMVVDDYPEMFRSPALAQTNLNETTQEEATSQSSPSAVENPKETSLPVEEGSPQAEHLSLSPCQTTETPYPNARIIRPAPVETRAPSATPAVAPAPVAQPLEIRTKQTFPNARIIQPAPGHGQVSVETPHAVTLDSSIFVPSQEVSQGKALPQDAEYASVAEAVAQAMGAPQEERPAPPAPPSLPPKNILPLPPLDLLDPLPDSAIQERPDSAVLERQGEAVITCLKNFNVHATLAKITPGPVITMFEVRPAPGVKATRITNLADDLAMSLKATAVRMQAPVPGTDTVGVEVPNQKRSTVYFREIVQDESFRSAPSLLNVALGKDTGGRPFSADLARMPHLLVAGATGQGKSVCLNAILLSLLCRARPDEVQLILVDPKRVEFSMYADLPHLVHPVVTDMDLTKNALLWAIDEMNRRLSLFSKVQVRNITGYNERQTRLRKAVEAGGPAPVDAETGEPEDLANMPFLVIVVDELADLMMIKRKEVEGSIVRLAQLARAAGIHLIIATQRPSVDVVTGLIKVNFPCRIAFKVTSSQDSRTILDGVGAEKLLGMGDMLFKASTGMIKRIHGAFVSDAEVSALVEYWKKLQKPNYKVDFSEFGNDDADGESEGLNQGGARSSDIVDDPMYAEAIQFALENGKVSISLLQRRFRIGFNRAARFVDQMERDGILSEADGSKPRSVVRR